MGARGPGPAELSQADYEALELDARTGSLIYKPSGYRARITVAELSRRLTEYREHQKAENTRRTFAGLTSPLFEAVAALFESDALARFACGNPAS